MKCPNCGIQGKAQFKVCRSCGEVFANQDILEYYQLEYLINETAVWEVAETVRSPYAEKLEKLRARLQRKASVEPVAAEH